MQYAADKHDPALVIGSGDPQIKDKDIHITEIPPVYDGAATEQAEYLDSDKLPTQEELATLRRVPDHVPVKAYTIAFVELLERLSYYGTTQVSEIGIPNSFREECETDRQFRSSSTSSSSRILELRLAKLWTPPQLMRNLALLVWASKPPLD